ncbi:cytochrome c oxidase subunit 2 [Asticcacaulis endophyticus]|uniref:Cytochrome c oxidase subunit 2 n=2 Tax=Asticcacaulis endophyticus TaxID=1395890 RepID=A0A918QA30_9CAUL|nr:cytochrome c oxidase subunit II [Asticcacaulis endophyticus]GGZ37149.1 cytochrome c oxidase subunit 2 [Asticcacaulis endophyticus]
MGFRRLIKTSSILAGMAMLSGMTAMSAFAADTLGQPTDGAIDLQPAAAPLKHDAIFFHDVILMPIITAITLLVLALLIWIAVRYNRKSNPVPAKFSHNTVVEIIWTVVPVLILVFIAFFSFSLLRKYHDMPKPDVVVKATGFQWYWAYDYPELGVEGVESRVLTEEDAKKAGKPYLLAADNALVVPVGKVVHVKVTAFDVIHAFALPAFGLKTDAVPGRLNDTWFKAEKVGTYYGQCSELCGVDHAYMPIEIKVVTDAEFDDYIIKAGGKTKAMLATEARAAQTQAAADAAKAAADAEAAATASATAPATETAPAAAAETPAIAATAAVPAATPAQ